MMNSDARVVRRVDDLPKELDEAEVSGEPEIHAQHERIIIESVVCPRAGWRDAARSMAERGEDTLLDPATPTEFDGEWTWHSASASLDGAGAGYGNGDVRCLIQA